MSDEKKEISKVPSPIEPLSGGGSTFVVIKWREVAEKPNWREWAHIPQVQVWQACALSLDIEPNSIKRNPNSWMTGPGIDQLFKDESFQSENEKKEFESRQRILLKNFGSKENSLCFSIHPEHANLSEVRLPEFAAWCPSVEWSIPKELAALAEESETSTIKSNLSIPKNEPKKVIIARFDGLHFNAKQWKGALADPSPWL